MERQLRELISEYEYGLHQIQKPSVRIRRSDHDGTLLIGPELYDFTDKRKHGVCHELAAKAKRRIASEMPGLHVLTAIGSDGRLFRGRHHYLLVSEQELLQSESTFSPFAISQVWHADPLIVDPTFGAVRRFKGSEYTAHYLTKSPEEHADQILGHGVAVPLGIAGSAVVTLVGWPEYWHGAAIGIRNGTAKMYDPVEQFDQLHKRLTRHPRLAQDVAAIREKLTRP